MNGFGVWLRQFIAKLTASLRNFMNGRYGMDRLNMMILWAGVLSSLLSALIRVPPVNLIFWVLSYAMMILAIFRMLSRNTYKRYQENRKFLMLVDRLKDRKHKYFQCPRCHQPVRVPRGKGKISITCPKCKEKFVKKT